MLTAYFLDEKIIIALPEILSKHNIRVLTNKPADIDVDEDDKSIYHYCTNNNEDAYVYIVSSQCEETKKYVTFVWQASLKNKKSIHDCNLIKEIQTILKNHEKR